MVVVIEMVMLEEVDREITKKEADNVAGNISNLYSAKIYIWNIENGFVYNYFCAQRKADKGGKVCRATLTVETNEDGSDPWPLVKTALRPAPWGGRVGSHIWENFPKKVFFLETFPY